MVMIPQNDSLQDRLNNTIISQLPRSHTGLSAIGEPCYRKLQYGHYWANDQKYTAQKGRIFATGHKAEPMIEADLFDHGIKVQNQQRQIIGSGGHWKGHIDGTAMIKGLMHLIEMKTHNYKSFADLEKKKVLKSKPVHYAQMQTYMGYLKLSRALYIAYNKNDSRYYVEFVDFDDIFFKELVEKEMEILTADTLLPRIGTGVKSWFACKLCDCSDICFGDVEIKISCRTCSHVDVMPEGQWRCNLLEDTLNYPDQIQGCSEYTLSKFFAVNE